MADSSNHLNYRPHRKGFMPKARRTVHPSDLPYGAKTLVLFVQASIFHSVISSRKIDMKKFTFAVLAILTAFAVPALAADVMVASTMQRLLLTNEKCKLVTNSCADNCGFVPR